MNAEVFTRLYQRAIAENDLETKNFLDSLHLMEDEIKELKHKIQYLNDIEDMLAKEE